MRPIAMITICKYYIKLGEGVNILCPAGLKFNFVTKNFRTRSSIDFTYAISQS